MNQPRRGGPLPWKAKRKRRLRRRPVDNHAQHVRRERENISSIRAYLERQKEVRSGRRNVPRSGDAEPAE